MKTTNIIYAIAAIVLALVCSIAVVLSSVIVERNLVIIDADAGSGDAVAIFYLLKAEKHPELSNSRKLKIMAITCVHGHTEVDNVVLNVLKVLNTANRLDIPVYRGAERSLFITTPHGDYYGMDGMGDVPSYFLAHPDLLETEQAVSALLRIVNEYPGQITLLALGPLTNVAMAARLDAGFLKKLKKLIIRGGSSKGTEFNFLMDPEAVHVVFNGTDTNPNSICLVPWETILKAKITWDWRKNHLGALQSPEALFINAIEHIDDYEKTIQFHGRGYNRALDYNEDFEYDEDDEELWLPVDSLAAAVLVDKEAIVEDMKTVAITSIMTGKNRGQIELDHGDHLRSKTKVGVILAINTEEFKSSLMRFFD